MPLGMPGLTEHLWILVTEPTPDGLCVTVNVTTPNRKRMDMTVCLQVGEHRFITGPSIITYMDAQFEIVGNLLRYFQSGFAIPHDPCSAPLLKRIQDGLLKSPDTKNCIRDFCKARWEK